MIHFTISGTLADYFNVLSENPSEEEIKDAIINQITASTISHGSIDIEVIED